MLQRWSGIIFSLCSLTLFFSSCTRSTSTTNTDTPLPAAAVPSIIISCDNQVVYAFDPTTGTKHWELALPPVSGNPNVEFAPSPLLYGGRLYVTTINSDTVYKINPQTGKIVAKFTPDQTNIFTVKATPIADGKLLYIATTNNNIYAIDTGNGSCAPGYGWQYTADGPLVSSPTIYQSHLYIASTNGTVYDLDKSSGTPNWYYQPLDTAGSRTPKFVSSPAISYPYLYIGSTDDSTMYCLYATGVPAPSGGVNPLERWRFKAKGAIYSSPTALAGHIIFGSNDNRVYCIDSSINPLGGVNTPRVIWSDSTNNQVWSSPFANSNSQVIFVGSYDYSLYALNIKDGSIKWNFATTGLIKSSPLAYKGLVYVASYDKRLYAVDSATGTVKWYQNINSAIQCSPVIDDLSNRNQNNSGISGYVQ